MKKGLGLKFSFDGGNGGGRSQGCFLAAESHARSQLLYAS